MVFINTRKACQQLGVHPNTLRAWDKAGKIKTMRTPGGIRMYDLASLETDTRIKVIYARVSSRGQKDDLKRQIEHLRTRYPGHELIEDIGSGLNFKRTGFNALLERIMSGGISEVVVAHKDRLCRFGYELFATIAGKYNCRIVVLDETQLSPQNELVQDIISILHVFSCRLYGLRKYGGKIKTDPDLPKPGDETPD
jgi:predicted site-specific integrase-resolvase